jgi:hypothetical protein
MIDELELGGRQPSLRSLLERREGDGKGVRSSWTAKQDPSRSANGFNAKARMKRRRELLIDPVFTYYE